MVKEFAMAEAPPAKTQLTSWKEVAAFLNATPRTVMRWEHERGLPIRRLPGEARSRIYANVAELKAWLDSNVATTAPAATAALEAVAPIADAPSRHAGSIRPILRRWMPGAFALVVGALAAFVLLRPAPALVLPPEAQVVYDTANQNFDRRTPASLAAAVEGFMRVIRLAPQSAEGFAGLASVYAILPEYTAMGAAEGFAKAEDYARRAIARDKHSARAWAALGFARYYGEQDRKTADSAFARAVAIEPENVQARHWRATYYLATGRLTEALTEIDAALALDPASLALQADRGLILSYLGRTGEAIAILKKLAAQAPEFRSPPSYLAQVAFLTGDDTSFVRESLVRARLQNDLYGLELAEAARAGLALGGRTGMLKALLAVRLRHYESGKGSAIEIARLQLLLGDREAARRYLNLGVSRREPDAAYLDLYPDLKSLRDPDAS